MTHGSESGEFRRSVSRLAGPRELTPGHLAQAWHETKVSLAPGHGFLSAHLQPWAELGLPRRRLEEDVAEVLLDGRIKEHVLARGAAAAGPAKLSVAVSGVCREFVDVEVRDAVMARAALEAPGQAPGTLSFSAAVRLLLLRIEKADELAAVAGEVAQAMRSTE